MEQKRTASGAVSEAYDWVEWFISIIICVVFLLTFAIRTVGVYGISMEPNLHEGDRLVATRLGGAFQYGDIVAITQPNSINEPLIKRVIATGGQTVDIDFEAGSVTVDGKLLDEPYIAETMTTDGQYDVQFPVTVPEGYYFCMGDNRNNSWDSRAEDIGMIDGRYILGKAIFRFAPLNSIGPV